MSSRNRRTHFILGAVAIALIYVLFFSSTDSHNSFRTRTEAAIAHKHSIMTGDISDEDLKKQTDDALTNLLHAKDAGYQGSGTQKQGVVVLEGTRRPEARLEAENEEVSVAGRVTMPKTSAQQSAAAVSGGREKPKYPLKQEPLADGSGTEEAFNGAKLDTATDPGEERARVELQAILKRSPIIIFSKSFCPHSKKAKRILLEKYDIVPEPYVVELDKMVEKIPKYRGANVEDEDETVVLGKKVQDLLYTLTGRKTVPNVMISAQSLGGGDEVGKLDVEGGLEERIKKMGGKRIVSVEKHKDE